MHAPLSALLLLLGQTAVVHIDSPTPVHLMRVTSHDEDFPAVGVQAERVCTSPCDAEIELGAPFFVEAKGVRRSRELVLEGPRATLRVEPGSAALYRTGIVGFGVAVALALLGGVGIAYGAVFPNRPVLILGALGGAMGVGAAIGALFLTISNRTLVTVLGDPQRSAL